ncbi:MAG: LysR family transcriptional regulator [Pseudomonadota bacterium]
MQIELSLLRAFVAIADNGNFVTAAERVGKSPSSITMQIKRLEDVIGEPLFQRDARSTHLTRAGEKLMPYARRILAAENEIASAFQPESIEGDVQLGVPDDVIERFPMPMLRLFRDAHPNVTLTVNVDHTPALLRKVDDGELDLAVITHARSIPGVSQCERILVEAEVWATNRTGIAFERTPLPVALWEEGWAWYQDAIDILNGSGMDYEIVLQCENISGRRAAILADLAVGPLPVSHMGDDLIPAPNMEHLPPLPDYGLGLKLPQRPNAAVATLAEHIRQHYSRSSLTRS